MTVDLNLNVLPDDQLQLFELLSVQSFIGDFYMAGGTDLALQIGHRRSYDFDFFIPADFNTSSVINKLKMIGEYSRESEEKNTINGRLNGVRISFFGYQYKMIDDVIKFNILKLAGLKDIAAMKLEAIAGRGSKKDFIDLFFLLQRYSLEEMFSYHEKKYGTGLNNQYHLLKSLVYFADAEEEPMPVMIEPLKWGVVKKHIVEKVKQFKM